MRLIRILTAVGTVGAGLFLAAPAQASGPVGSCADGFVLRSASIQPSTDLNGDGTFDRARSDATVLNADGSNSATPETRSLLIEVAPPGSKIADSHLGITP